MRQFLGLLLWMGLVRMPTIDLYWRQTPIFENSIAARTMTRNRFQLLLRMWLFADNTAMQANDRLHKVKSLADMLMFKFQGVKKPSADMVVDETMVSFHGSLSFRQYIPGKSSNYGIKIYKLCDKSGYTYAYEIYAGKGSSAANEIVLKLAEPYLDVGRTMSTDNFYTSLPLARALLDRHTHLVGTL